MLALEGWLADLDQVEKAALVEAIPSAALILPSLGAPPVDGRAGLVTVVDGLLTRAVARAPTVLVVDDVHWADPATWDALSYLVAGFARQPMALLTTHRDEVVGDADFQRWLAAPAPAAGHPGNAAGAAGPVRDGRPDQGAARALAVGRLRQTGPRQVPRQPIPERASGPARRPGGGGAAR